MIKASSVPRAVCLCAWSMYDLSKPVFCACWVCGPASPSGVWLASPAPGIPPTLLAFYSLWPRPCSPEGPASVHGSSSSRRACLKSWCRMHTESGSGHLLISCSFYHNKTFFFVPFDIFYLRFCFDSIKIVTPAFFRFTFLLFRPLLSSLSASLTRIL